MSKKTIIITLVCIVVITISVFGLLQRNDQLSNTQLFYTQQSKELKNHEQKIDDRQSGNGQFSDGKTNTSELEQPAWVKLMLSISTSSTMNRDEKITKLISMIESNTGNTDVESAVLLELSNLNPIEAYEKIIPYIHSKNETVAINALAALNNSMIPVDEEFKSQETTEKNNAQRKQISKAINDLLKQDISENIRNSIVAGYATTNTSIEDTTKMVDAILNKKTSINLPESSYISAVVIRSEQDAINMLPILVSVNDQSKKLQIANSLINALSIDNPVISILSTKTKNSLSNYLRNNPPQLSSNPNENIQLEQWNIVMNKLQEN